MFLRDLLSAPVDRVVEFRSPVDLEQSTARLASVARTRGMVLFGMPGLVGRVSEGYVFLKRQTSMSSSRLRAQFVGRFESDEQGVMLRGHIGLPSTTRLIALAALAILVVWTAVKLSQILLGDGASSVGGDLAERFREPLLGVLCMAVVLALGVFSKWQLNRDTNWISERIENALAGEGAGSSTQASA